MSTQTMVMLIVLVLFAGAVWKMNQLRGMILCRYTSRTKQTYEKIVPEKSGHVIFDGHKFTVVTRCVKHHWHKVFAVFPMYMPQMDFIWNSKYPVDPDTGEPVVMDADTEAVIDEQGMTANYFRGQNQAMQGGKPTKLGGLAQYLPLIAIGLVVVVAGYFYMQNKAINSDMNVIKLTLQDVLNRMPK